MNSSYSGQLGKLFFSGGDWNLYEGGVTSHGKIILWQDVDEIFISGSITTIQFMIPAGEKHSIKVVDYSKNTAKITLSGFFRMSGAQKDMFAIVYNFILQNVSGHQWIQFLKRLEDGKKVTFGELDVFKDGFYFNRLLRRPERVEKTSIIDCEAERGFFYIEYSKPSGELIKKNIGYVELIPNIHILQNYIKEIHKQ